MQYCSYCGKRTHSVVNCPSTWAGSVNRMTLRCTYCGSSRHSIKACPSLRINPEQDRRLDDEYYKD